MFRHTHQGHVNAIGGGSAHHPGHDHVFLYHARHHARRRGTFSSRFSSSIRTCSPNSHSFRESLSTVTAEGSFTLRSIFADFFLNASTRCTDSATRLANLGSRSVIFTKPS